ncbi:MAG: ABC transporter ATP-binding protein [Colwellia sp.]
MKTPVIECKNLEYSYGEKNILQDLSFHVNEGAIFGLLGKNGAGKSTIINIMMGFLQPLSGECSILGDASHSLSIDTRRQVALLHEGFIQYDFMSIKQLHEYFSAFYPNWNQAVFYELVDKMSVPYTRKLSNLSCGQRSQVVLALLLAQMPKVMILDDYSMGLDIGYRQLFIDYLAHYVKKYHATVLLTSHVVQELYPILDEFVILKNGQLATHSNKDEFMQNFSGYQFKQTDKSTSLQADKEIVNIEQHPTTTCIYGFINENKAKDWLDRQVIPYQNWTVLDMNFENAFIGLTGRY